MELRSNELSKDVKYHQQNTDNYKFIHLVSTGGYGEVYKAKHINTNKDVAIKFINIKSQSIEMMRALFREIKILYFLTKHKNNFTTRLYDIFMPPGAEENIGLFTGFYLVLEYIPSDISSLIHGKNMILSYEQIVIIAYNLLNAIRFVHSCNIVHRDIKPSNVLIDKRCKIKLCDFGMARSLRMVGQHEDVKAKVMSLFCFTENYIPPEVVAKCTNYGAKADIWGYGLII